MSKNSKIGHDLFVYRPRGQIPRMPNPTILSTGTKPGTKIVTTDNNSNTRTRYAPPKGHRI